MCSGDDRVPSSNTLNFNRVLIDSIADPPRFPSAQFLSPPGDSVRVWPIAVPLQMPPQLSWLNVNLRVSQLILCMNSCRMRCAFSLKGTFNRLLTLAFT
ncbi:hypothetical protein F4806DRAFT_380600 [Annulohypoxylon nitens]|nr:hypothetical protein F4806DRAFT_380600 [Annulohypoxylon nitens]